MTALLKQHRRIFLFDPRGDPKFERWPITETWAQAIYRSRAPSFRIHFRSKDPKLFERVCETAFRRGDCVVAIDEIHEYVSNQFASIPEWFQLLCLGGRHNDVSVIGCTQRAQRTHKDFLHQAATDRLCVFRMLREDLGTLKQYEMLRNVPYLPPGRYIQMPAELPQFPPSRKKIPQRIAPDMA